MKLKIALQKSGKLAEGSTALLRKCGIGFSNGLGKLRTEAADFPLEIFFLRDDDIPNYVADGVADVGIVGENVIAEDPKPVETIDRLGFGHCRLSIAVPKGIEYNGISDLRGKRIATSYPKILAEFFTSRSITADIHMISGSVEIAPSIGLADAVCDLVSSGSTLFSNGLREVETVMNSEAVLIARTGLNSELSETLNRLLFRIRSVNAASQNKYILLNAPVEKVNEISAILPGMKSPTVVPLAENGWVSVHSVISQHDFWDVVDNLKRAGAEGILVLSIDQMIR
ncbi:MAG: ATP phosphoribosyltransferase [Pyrinomonadaceae bacterium]|jgi:ATP phosphoribosyltransferase|nr:ATP phosphoribosyltransferase [Pyrinomonadaceae bacterium]